MREILFRAKRVDNEEWMEGFIVARQANTYPDGFEIIETDGINYDELDFWQPAFQSYGVYPETICQYTGLTDNASNKVFENSIIKLISENVFGIVKFGEYKSSFENEETKHVGFYVDWENDDRCKFWRKDLGYWLNASTVICGDIFDNNMGGFNGR